LMIALLLVSGKSARSSTRTGTSACTETGAGDAACRLEYHAEQHLL
jgi:hypothetical protein